MDKRERSELFRTRLQQALISANSNRSQLARQVGSNRSTISQLLDPSDTRLPSANLVAECAQALGVSSDWLLGLTQQPEPMDMILDASFQMPDASRAPSDDQILTWHRQADGAKIRHVPATLPDILKTRSLLRWEYEAFLGKTPDQAIAAFADRLNWVRQANSDYEICLPMQEVQDLVQGQGYYADLHPEIREAQVDHLLEQVDGLYPGVRLFLFDIKRYYSAPLTIFGRSFAALYVGSTYLGIRQQGRITALIQHFDSLIRNIDIDSRGFGAFIHDLRAA